MPYHLITANFLMLLAFIFTSQKLPPQIPLFYSRPWGESQITDWWMIFLVPILMNTIYFINFLVYKKFFSDNDLAKAVFRYFNLFMIIIFTFIFLKIIFLIS